MNRYKNSIAVRLEDDTLTKFQALADARGITTSEYLRELVKREVRDSQSVEILGVADEFLIREFYTVKGLLMLLTTTQGEALGRPAEFGQNLGARAQKWAEPRAERAIAEANSELRRRRVRP